MEIISYVGFDSSRSISKKKIAMLPLQFFRTHRKIQNPRRNNYRVKVNAAYTHRIPNVSIKSAFYASKPFFKFTGRFIKSHILFLICALFCCVGCVAVVSFLSFRENHTGPIVLRSNSIDSEFDVLKEIMSKYVLDENVRFAENGVILDSEGNEIKNAAALAKKTVTFENYTVKSGDTISELTKRFGLTNISTLIAVNNISNATGLRIGQKLLIPSIDGLNYNVREGDTLETISTKYSTRVEDLLDANDLSTQTLSVGQEIFIPGARLSNDKLSQVLGTYFSKPLSNYRITSRFGNRSDPFTGQKSFHTGIDLACPSGTPIKSTQAGIVSVVSYSNIFGHYIIVNHGNGYQSLYAHLLKVTVARGQSVSQGAQIGLAGSTGYSTGPHLHFTVYKNGSLVNPATLVKF